ncbi:DUF4180 domain-containing protein [Salmonirosea aquatica]|uniref:DUF4180 domain-containing protein n=1 Tax=Salmonirosea aquatica TaxID=2654236 RepID=A0A7C9FAZ5_9BACT|nr:DUF4180 domain-containing protein [Cytophagaceae bacterium SJW1-29]
MKIEDHTLNSIKIAEVLSEESIIKTAEDGLDLLGNLYYQGFDGIILYEKNIVPEFFDLKNGMAGEILQKFSNYRVRLAIVGDFTAHTGNSIRDFMYESNKGRQVAFVGSTDEALQKLA